jgi:2-C-methyl-D-erythritol 4-phosphate cytidylyltransferase
LSTKGAGSTGVAAIILAAGNGVRMGAPMNKVFLFVGGKSILGRTLEVFERMAIVQTVVLVAASVDRAMCEITVADGGFRKVRPIVTGGATRHASEFRGLLALDDEIASGTIDTVLIHDAVRPFVGAEEVERLVEMTRDTGAAILAMPAGDRLVTIDEDGTIHGGATDLWIAQTPQGFQARIALDAHRRAAEDGFVGTDTSSVVERTGQTVSVVMGRAENIKITTSDDLLRAELIAEQASDGFPAAALRTHSARA